MANNSENIKEMLEQLYSGRDQTGDAIFIVESQQIRAHRNVLAACSPKYKAQFYGPNPDQGEIRIPNVSAAAFQEFLQFFYKEKVDLTMGHIASVLDLAQQSLVEGIIEICVDFLKKSITTGNVCFVYHLAIIYDIECLRLDCKQLISSKSMDVFASDDFLQCNRKVLLHILNWDAVSCSEKDVFNACITWARADCKRKSLDEMKAENLRSALGDAIYLIRFASMNAKEFAILNKSVEGFFVAHELNELLYITNKLNDFTPKMFSNTLRASCGQSNDRGRLETFSGRSSWSMECNRIKYMKDKHGNTFDDEVLKFSCDTAIRLHGFVLGVCLDESTDEMSFNAIYQLYGQHVWVPIELKCKLYRNQLNENETLFIFKKPIENIGYFQCVPSLPNIQVHYELFLKNIVYVGDVRFSNFEGKWVTRYLFDEM